MRTYMHAMSQESGKRATVPTKVLLSNTKQWQTFTTCLDSWRSLAGFFHQPQLPDPAGRLPTQVLLFQKAKWYPGLAATLSRFYLATPRLRFRALMAKVFRTRLTAPIKLDLATGMLGTSLNLGPTNNQIWHGYIRVSYVRGTGFAQQR